MHSDLFYSAIQSVNIRPSAPAPGHLSRPQTQISNLGSMEAVILQARLRMQIEKFVVSGFAQPTQEFAAEFEKLLRSQVVPQQSTIMLQSLASLVQSSCIRSIDAQSITGIQSMEQLKIYISSVAQKFSDMKSLQSAIAKFHPASTCTDSSEKLAQALMPVWYKPLSQKLTAMTEDVARLHFAGVNCEAQIYCLHQICSLLDQLGPQFAICHRQALSALFSCFLKERITNRTINSKTTGLLTESVNWFAQVFRPFCEQISPELQIDYHLSINECFVSKVTSVMLTLIVGGIEASFMKEIATALSLSKHKDDFVESTIHQIKSKLLKIVQSTEKILQIYLKTIEVFKQVDPTTALVSKVTEPIKDYLKNERYDTLSCIVNMILDPGQNMYNQLQHQRYMASTRNQINGTDDGYISTDDDEAAADQWQPHPLGFGQLYISARRRRNDQISNLIDIYGSQKEFLQIYRQILDKRLLTSIHCKFNEELKNLEHMKLRFGENSLYACDVMLHDIKESDRLNRQFKQLVTKPEKRPESLLTMEELKVNIVSPNFWKQVSDEEIRGIQMPVSLIQGFEDFEANFKKVKPMRKLNFSETLGQVKLTLNFEDGGAQSFTVSPLQAIVISAFSKKGQEVALSIEELQTKLSLERDQIETALRFWVKCGVLNELPGLVFQSCKSAKSQQQQSQFMLTETANKQKVEVLADEDSFELQEQLHKLAREQMQRVMQESPNYSLRQVSVILRNVPALKHISDTLIKELYDRFMLNEKLV